MTASPPPREQFLAALRDNVDAWHAGDIDQPTFLALQRDVWDSIARGGVELERAVFRTLRDQLPPNCRAHTLLSATPQRRYRR